MRTGSRVQVEANRRVLVYADGELVGSLPAIFEVRPAALAGGGRAGRQGRTVNE